MTHYRSAIIGHITMDINVDPSGLEQRSEGGAVLFSSASAHGLGHCVCAVTKLAAADYDRLKAFRLPSWHVFCSPAQSSSDMKNIYLTPDREIRISTCTSRGDPFEIDDIPQEISAGTYHLAGLLYGDFSSEFIKALAKRGSVALDVQSVLRHRGADGKMFLSDWENKMELLPLITYLKTDAAEAEILTGVKDTRAAAELLYGWGAKEVVITHHTEIIAYDGKNHYAYPLRPRNLSGRTGRGDTAFAAFINERAENGIAPSLLWAAAAVSLKMETPGPFAGTRADVESYIDQFYGDFKC